MLKLILGEIGTGKSTLLYEDIRASVNEGVGGYLIVPEQNTLMTEQKLQGILPRGSALMLDITNFTRFANTVFRAVGGLSRRSMTETVRMLVMWRILAESYPFLSDKPDRLDSVTVKNALSAMAELRASCIYPAMLEAVMGKCKSRRLREKLSDLSFIMTAYNAFIEDEYSDTEEELKRLCDALEKNDVLSGKRVYIDSFTSFTEQQYRVLSRIMRRCDVSITVPFNAQGDKGCYAEGMEFQKRLADLADRDGIEVQRVYLNGNKRTKSPLLRHVADGLFGNSYTKYEGESEEALSVVRCTDIYSECDYVCADIMRRVRGGARFGEIAIAVADTSSYRGIIDAALRKYNIPAFTDERTDISSLELIKYIYSAYAVRLYGYRREDVMTYMKCALSPLTALQCDLLEIYTDKWGIDRREMFCAKDDWSMRFNGYTESPTKRLEESNREKLKAVNKARRALLEPLDTLLTAGEHTVSDYCRNLFEFLESARIWEKLDERARVLKNAGDRAGADCYSRLWQSVCDCLDTLADILGDKVIGCEQFTELLKIVFESVSIGRIPTSLDEVSVLSADTSRIEGKKYVYIMGANDGVFPIPVNRRGTFSQAEELELASFGINVGHSLEDSLQRSLFSFLRAMLAPSDALTVSYHMLGAGMEALSPAPQMAKLEKIVNGRHISIRDTDISPSERIFTEESARDVISSMADGDSTVLSEALSGEGVAYTQMTELLGRDAKREVGGNISDTHKLFGDELVLTKSKIESFVKCPLSYYCSDILRLDSGERYSFNAADTGTFVHALLEGLFKRLEAEGKRIYEVSEGELERHIEEIALHHVESLSRFGDKHSRRMLHLFERLENSAKLVARKMRAQLGNDGFYPSFFELSVSRHGDVEPVKFTLSDGTALSLKGKIDRVDTYERDGKTYVKIVDYKTGNRTFSLSDIDKGLGLQLLIYMKSVLDNADALIPGERESAGVSYMMVNVKPRTSEQPIYHEEAVMTDIIAELKESGVVLDDDDIICAMNRGDKNFSDKLSDVKGRKSGEELRELFGEALRAKVVEIGDRIISGEATVPSSEHLKKYSSCSYCGMKSICRKMLKVGFR